MDLVHYDPPLPELPLLRGVRLPGLDPLVPLPRFDWASYVIRLAKAVAERKPGPPSA